MYKFKSYMMAMLAVGSMAFLSSCGKDDDAKPSPTIVLTGGNAVDGATVQAGTPITTGVTITSNGGSNIKSYDITVAYDGEAGEAILVEEEDVNQPNVTVPFSTMARTIAGTEKYTFTATNKDGKTTTKVVTITVTGNASGMESYTAKILGNQQAAAGSFLNATGGTVYTSSTVRANAASLDLIYYYSIGGEPALVANKATFVSPNDADAASIFGSSTTADVATWSKRNNTTFKMTNLTPANFVSASSGTQLEGFYDDATANAESDATNLTVGKVIAFMTEDGKHGLIHVAALKAATSADDKSEITVDVKVQQ